MNKTCFVVCPIGHAGSPERKLSDTVLEYIIKPVCSELGYNPIRVDQENTGGDITQSIINHLKNDDLVIADLTGLNPNVFYELGYRQALGYPLIPICQKGGNLPFDVSVNRTLFYSTDVGEFEESKDALKKMIESFNNYIMPNKRTESNITLDTLNGKLDKILEKVSIKENSKPFKPDFTDFKLKTDFATPPINPQLHHSDKTI